MTNLIKYDAARFALQQAVAVDEVKDIRDKAQAMAAYAKQAKDTELVQWATEIKVRAERKAGQMLAELGLKSGNPELSVKNANPSQTWPPQWSHDATIGKTLPELGISKTQSSRWQKLASVPEEQFEQAVAAAKEVAGEVTTAAMLRIEKANRPEVAPQLAPKKKAPQPENPAATEEATETESYPQADDNEHLENLIAQSEEMMAELADLHTIIAADDKLAAACAELKKEKALSKILNERMNGLMNEKNALIQTVKSRDRTIKKLEEQLKKIETEKF